MSTNGFREEDPDEEDGVMGIFQFILDHLDKFYVNHIPVDSIKDLSTFYMYTFGAFAYMVSIAIFVYFVVQSYDNAVDQAFISISSGGGATCNSVPISITGTFLADKKGNWEGSPAFVYSSALYSISLNNFQVQSYSEYERMMSVFNESLHSFGEISKYQDLTTNLVIWTGYRRYYSVQATQTLNISDIGFGQLQAIELTGLPSQIFNLYYVQGTIGSSHGYCNVPTSTVGFDQSNNDLLMTYNHANYSSSTICEDASHASTLGYVETFDDNEFSVHVDVRSFITAMAVNLDILPIDDLAIANYEVQIFTTANTTFELGQYYDLRYPEMDPILCVKNTSIYDTQSLKNIYSSYHNGTFTTNSIPFNNICFYSVGNTVTLPIFNHFGSSKVQPKSCSCKAYGLEDDSCNIFNFLTTLLFYPIPKTGSSSNFLIISQVTNIIDLIIRHDSFRTVNNLAYNASWAGAAKAYGDMAPYTRSSLWLKDQFSFCTTEKGSCSLMVFNSYNPTDQLVSEYKYQLVNGSCRNKITIPNDYWQKLVDHPPVQLTQDYYECYSGDRAALINAVGVAVGNTSLAVPFIVIMCLPFIYMILVLIKQVPPPDEYSKDEKEEAIETLATLLLRMRDGKTRGVKANGVLVTLTKELISAAKEENGIPDSDDEDSDEEGERESDDDRNESSEERPQRKYNPSFKPNRPISTTSTASKPIHRERDSDDDSVVSEQGRNTRASRKSQNRKDRSSKGSRPSTASERPSRITRPRMMVFTKPRPSISERPSQAPYGAWVGVMHRFRNSSQKAPAERELTSYNNRPTINFKILFVDISQGDPPSGITILNQATTKHTMQLLKGSQLERFIDDLVKLLTNTTNLLRRYQQASVLTTADMYLKLKASDDYQQSCVKARMLCTANFDAFFDRDDQSLFNKLSNVICMHASIELQCEIKHIEIDIKDKVGYNVGGRLVTVGNLLQLIH